MIYFYKASITTFKVDDMLAEGVPRGFNLIIESREVRTETLIRSMSMFMLIIHNCFSRIAINSGCFLSQIQ